MFVDEVKINVIAGKGGNGALAFRREKYIAMGGPYGGNGGKGGSIYFKGDSGLRTLVDLGYRKMIKADNGENGMGKNMHGKDASDTYINVPLGTVVYDEKGFLGEIKKDGETLLVAKGGDGGRGNTSFKTQSNPAPNYAENGSKGESKELKVELKMLADCGLVGMPSVGKSTIISKVSRAKPKIADYAFTTLHPHLGVVKTRNTSFVLCDLPGLIEGASSGAGLGYKFLRHIERCKIIAHVLDMSRPSPYDDFLLINNELSTYSKILASREMIVLFNKMDAYEADQKAEELLKKIPNKCFKVSALTGEGLSEAMEYIAGRVDEAEDIKLEIERKEYIYDAKEEDFIIEKDNNIYTVSGKKIDDIMEKINFNTEEAYNRFMGKLKGIGLMKALRAKGIQEGDKVIINNLSFDYKE